MVGSVSMYPPYILPIVSSRSLGAIRRLKARVVFWRVLWSVQDVTKGIRRCDRGDIPMLVQW